MNRYGQSWDDNTVNAQARAAASFERRFALVKEARLARLRAAAERAAEKKKAERQRRTSGSISVERVAAPFRPVHPLLGSFFTEREIELAASFGVLGS